MEKRGGHDAICLQYVGPPGPVPAVVAFLEDMLEQARAGEIIGVVVATSCQGRFCGFGYRVGEGTLAGLVLGLEYAKAELLREGAG